MLQESTRQLRTSQETRLPIGYTHAAIEPNLEDPVEIDLSHELRTSLAIITLLSGNLDLLYAQLDDNRRHRMIQDIRKHTRRVNELVGEVLELCNDNSPLVM